MGTLGDFARFSSGLFGGGRNRLSNVGAVKAGGTTTAAPAAKAAPGYTPASSNTGAGVVTGTGMGQPPANTGIVPPRPPTPHGDAFANLPDEWKGVFSNYNNAAAGPRDGGLAAGARRDFDPAQPGTQGRMGETWGGTGLGGQAAAAQRPQQIADMLANTTDWGSTGTQDDPIVKLMAMGATPQQLAGNPAALAAAKASAQRQLAAAQAQYDAGMARDWGTPLDPNKSVDKGIFERNLAQTKMQLQPWLA